jgi:hypothetical protein
MCSGRAGQTRIGRQIFLRFAVAVVAWQEEQACAKLHGDAGQTEDGLTD